MIGGGIHGAAVARDAALRGLSVLLVERGDLASGTSSRSSKLLHGGLRYLETGQIGLVREALREREILLRIAPPSLVRPLRFLLPHYSGTGRPGWWIDLGLRLYGVLAGSTPRARCGHVGRREALELEPGLSPRGLRGGSLYWDAQMDDALLCVATACGAAEAGAEVLTYTDVAGLRAEGGRWRAFLRGDVPGGGREAEARAVVNAAGPWVDEVRALAGHTRDARLRRSRGTHVVVPAVTAGRGLLLTARRDGRVYFVLPWGAHSLIGTTDVDVTGPPGDVGPTVEDVAYLLEEAHEVLPSVDPRARPLRAFAGVRSLLRSRAAEPSANPREHRVVVEGTLVSLVGGKYTTHRSLAESVVDRVVAELGARAKPCATATTPLADRRVEAMARLGDAHPAGVDAGNGLEWTEAATVHAVRSEFARRLEDVLLRRSPLWLDGVALRRAAPLTVEWMSRALGWGEAMREMELRRFLAARDREERVLAEAVSGGREAFAAAGTIRGGRRR